MKAMVKTFYDYVIFSVKCCKQSIEYGRTADELCITRKAISSIQAGRYIPLKRFVQYLARQADWQCSDVNNIGLQQMVTLQVPHIAWADRLSGELWFLSYGAWGMRHQGNRVFRPVGIWENSTTSVNMGEECEDQWEMGDEWVDQWEHGR